MAKNGARGAKNRVKRAAGNTPVPGNRGSRPRAEPRDDPGQGESPQTTRLDARFLVSAPDLARCPPADRPEVAVAGRSNAGKSSILNRLTGNRQTAKVSKTPGRTQLINFFDVATGGRLVDLPGYGYAKAGRAPQEAWQRAVNEYLSFRETLVGVVLVMDIRHPFQPFDVEMLEWSEASELPLLILLNKADKLKSGARKTALLGAERRIRHQHQTSVQLFSALRGMGTEECIATLRAWLSAPRPS